MYEFNFTCVSNLVTLDYKMSPRMPKLISSLNGPLCTYLRGQNLHNLTFLRCYGSECPCLVWKWFMKNCGCESINGFDRPPIHLLKRQQYAGDLKGCGVKIHENYLSFWTLTIFQTETESETSAYQENILRATDYTNICFAYCMITRQIWGIW